MGCIMVYMFSQGVVNPNSAALAHVRAGRPAGRGVGPAGHHAAYVQLPVGPGGVSLWQTQSALPLAAVMRLLRLPVLAGGPGGAPAGARAGRGGLSPRPGRHLTCKHFSA